MATDSVLLRIARKELGLFFLSPVAWLFLAVFATTTLFVFFWVESFFARNIADVRPLFEWTPLLLIFLCSAITMRMWSEERSRGTLEHVLTQPFSVWHFVLGKFTACFVLLLLGLACTLPLPITVSTIADLDWGPVFGGYVAATLLGAMYLSIGLFASARTPNPSISLIVSVLTSSAFYLLGSAAVTGLFNDETAAVLRQLGSDSRFDNITRGIIDPQDLFYYLSMAGAFLALNVFALEKVRWAPDASASRRRSYQWLTGLILLNLVAANLVLHSLDPPRLDLTEGKIYSLSQSSREQLRELNEPLLIRGYFSSKTHPLLAPLVPQLRDLLKEYELAGGGKVKVEFVDPAMDPELEKEANEQYGIKSTPFRIADRHQASLVNAYFNILVRYGSDHQALGFSDLLEVRTTPNQPTEVQLRNPEYDITLAIRKALFAYHAGGNLFDGLDEPVELIAYVSRPELLPEPLREYKNSIETQLKLAASKSDGKFSFRFIEPESNGGATSRLIQERWGFKPMATSADDSREFFFYLTLANSNQVVQLPTNDFNPVDFRLVLDSGLKRFTRDFTKVVAISMPRINTQMARYNLGGPTFANLERIIQRDHNLLQEDLADGSVSPDADILTVIAPKELDDAAVFAIDQFLMRGGTVILATSPFSAQINEGHLSLVERNSGLQEWLLHHGLNVQNTVVLDKQHASFSAPVARNAGEHEFRDMQHVDYPYFIDLRQPGLTKHPATANLPQVTMAWASPITFESSQERSVSELLQSSNESWLRNDPDIMPTLEAGKLRSFGPENSGENPENFQAHTLGVVVEGRFTSFFAGDSRPESAPPGLVTSGMLERSPESARIILFASNDFMSDQVLKSIIAASGTRYLGPLELLMNTLDWALEGEALLDIRARGHFNRTLPPMEDRIQLLIEYINYGLALFLLLTFALVTWLWSRRRRHRYARSLAP